MLHAHQLQGCVGPWQQGSTLLSALWGVQAYVSKARVDSFSLTADMMYVAQNAPRICRALFEICLRRGWPQVAELVLSLCKVGPAPG